FRLGAMAIAGIGEAARVHVVAEKDDEARRSTRDRLGLERGQNRLGGARGVAGVAEPLQRAVDVCRLRRRQWHQRTRRRGAGWALGQRGRRTCGRLPYSFSTTATSSQQFWRGQRAQSAHTFSGKCSFSEGWKPSLRKKAGFLVRARTSERLAARASAMIASMRARPTPAP